MYTVHPVIEGHTRKVYVVPPPGANWVQDREIFTKHNLKAMRYPESSQSPFFDFLPWGQNIGQYVKK